MTITISEITHVTTGQALSYAMDYYANYYSPGDPPLTYHRFDHSEHIEVLATWGHYDLFFVQSRIKHIVLYGLPSEWQDEIAMRGWVFHRHPVTENWTTECDSTITNLHHWQEIHHLLKKEAPNMSDILDLLTEIRDSTANSEALLNALASEGTDLLRVEAQHGDKLYSLESIVEEQKFELELAAGINDLDGTPVPNDKLWSLRVAWIYYMGTPPSLLELTLIGLAGNVTIFHQDNPAASFPYFWTGDIYMQEGDLVRAYVEGATLNDDLYLRYAGLQMNAP